MELEDWFLLQDENGFYYCWLLFVLFSSEHDEKYGWFFLSPNHFYNVHSAGIQFSIEVNLL